VCRERILMNRTHSHHLLLTARSDSNSKGCLIVPLRRESQAEYDAKLCMTRLLFESKTSILNLADDIFPSMLRLLRDPIQISKAVLHNC